MQTEPLISKTGITKAKSPGRLKEEKLQKPKNSAPVPPERRKKKTSLSSQYSKKGDKSKDSKKGDESKDSKKTEEKSKDSKKAKDKSKDSKKPEKDPKDSKPPVPKDSEDEQPESTNVMLKEGVEYKDDLKGWNFGKTQRCGAFKTILGGPGVLGKGSVLEKTYHLPCHESRVSVFFRYARIDAWDGEEAWAKVNGKKHWKYKGKSSKGSRQCGKRSVRDGLWRIRMRDVHIVGRRLTVEIGSDLKAGPDVASFGIKDVVVSCKCIGGSTRKGKKFSANLGTKNGIPARKYEFMKIQTSKKEKRFSRFMRKECQKYGMKPVCDHKSYCKKDTRSLFLGQSHHLAFPPHRMNEKFVPSGFDKVAKRWDGLCSYTGDQGNGRALCNIPAKTHKWKKMQQDLADAFMCGRIAEFTVTMKHFGDTPGREYKFRVATTEKRSKSFSKAMIEVCQEYGMKPVCDHPKYCKDDKQSIYIGQKKHIAYQAHRLDDKNFPSGWNAQLKAAFEGICVYTGTQGSGKAICNIPLKKHNWEKMSDDANSFMCAKITKEDTKRERAPHLPKMILENLEAWTRIGPNEDKMKFKTSYHGKLPKGSAIESLSKISRPVTIYAEIMSPKSDCMSFSIFNKDRSDNGGLMMVPGSGSTKKDIKFYPSKATEEAKKLDQWRELLIFAFANGTTKFYYDKELYSRMNEGKGIRSGKIFAKATCDNMEIRNVKRSASPLYIRISNRNLYINADGGSKKGAKEKLKQCKKEDNIGSCQWWLEGSTTKPNHYQIRVSDSNLHLRASDKESGAGVKLHSCPASADSSRCQWEIIPSLTKEGFHYIKISNEDLFLIAEGDGKENSKVVLGRCKFERDMANCQWKLEGYKGGIKKGKKFKARLDEKNNIPTRKYVFQKLITSEKQPAWSPFMVKSCSYLGMRPVCDHPKYCQKDARSLYIGQEKHLAYPKHRKDEKAVPKGFDKIQKKWGGVCSYTGKHGSGKALCNIPRSKHSWMKMGEKKATDFICGQIAPFMVTLTGSGEDPSFKYEFRLVTTYRRDGSFKKVMLDECKRHGMKPVCDHQKYCKDDKEALYIGHQGHISNPENCEKKENFPMGWEKVNQNFRGICFYTGKEDGGKAMCNIPSTKNKLKKLSDKASSFMCGKIVKEEDVKPVQKGDTFEAMLGPNEAGDKIKYSFRKLTVFEAGVNFSKLMVEKCSEVEMRPVCDHPKYCKSDKASLYIGQAKHLAYPKHRESKYVPGGFSKIAAKWDKVCSYTGKHGSGKALCNIPNKTHAWKKPQQDGANSFICGKILETIKLPKPKPKAFTAILEAFDQIPEREYEFQITTTSEYKGTFSAAMVSECQKSGMKPVCDHPEYCATDDTAVYIGQRRHIAFPPQREKAEYFPKGWTDVQDNWKGLCSYTAANGAGKALCNIPSKTHSWKSPSEQANSFMCAKIVKELKPPTTTTTTTKPCKNSTAGCEKMPKVKACDEQLRDHNDIGYRGCQDTTISGYKCQKWTSQKPHMHKTATPMTTDGRGLGNHNYCRNADNSETIWCFTTNPKKRIDECEPKEKLGKYTMLQGDCKKSKAIKTFSQCSAPCCKQRCDRDLKCKGFSYNDETDVCVIRSDECKRQPGKCDPSKKGNDGFCFYEKGKAKMKKYRYYELRGDCNDNLIHTKKDISRKDCEKACTKIDECAGFSYQKEEMYCDLRKKACDHRRGKCLVKKCFMVKGRPKKKKERVQRNLAPGCKKMEFGVEYLGDSYKKIDRVTSAIKCNAHCVENVECNAWVWGMAKGTPKANICFLKKKWNKKRKNPDVVSGLPDRGGDKNPKKGKSKKMKAPKVAMIDGYARLKRSQRLERVQVIRRIKRQQKLARYRAMQKMRATQALRRLAQMRKLRKIQKKIRNLYLCRMRGKCPMPGQRVMKRFKMPGKVTGVKKMLKDLKKKRKRLKKDKKKLRKLLKKDEASKDDDDNDYQQFKQELFDDYEDRPKAAPKKASSPLYDGIWKDHDVRMRGTISKSRKSRKLKKQRLGSNFSLGFDSNRRKI